MLPSEVARLVLGYLHDAQCGESARVFLGESPHLSELRHLSADRVNCSTRILTMSLVDLLVSFCTAVEIVKTAVDRLGNPADNSQLDFLAQLRLLVKLSLSSPADSSQTTNRYSSSRIGSLPHSSEATGAPRGHVVSTGQNAHRLQSDGHRSLFVMSPSDKPRPGRTRVAGAEYRVSSAALSSPLVTNSITTTTTSYPLPSGCHHSSPHHQILSSSPFVRPIVTVSSSDPKQRKQRKRSHPFNLIQRQSGSPLKQTPIPHLHQQTPVSLPPASSTRESSGNPDISTDNTVGSRENAKEQEPSFLCMLDELLDNVDLHSRIADNINRTVTASGGADATSDGALSLDDTIRRAVDQTSSDPVVCRMLLGSSSGCADDGVCNTPSCSRPVSPVSESTGVQTAIVATSINSRLNSVAVTSSVSAQTVVSSSSTSEIIDTGLTVSWPVSEQCKKCGASSSDAVTSTPISECSCSVRVSESIEESSVKVAPRPVAGVVLPPPLSAATITASDHSSAVAVSTPEKSASKSGRRSFQMMLGEVNGMPLHLLTTFGSPMSRVEFQRLQSGAILSQCHAPADSQPTADRSALPRDRRRAEKRRSTARSNVAQRDVTLIPRYPKTALKKLASCTPVSTAAAITKLPPDASIADSVAADLTDTADDTGRLPDMPTGILDTPDKHSCNPSSTVAHSSPVTHSSPVAHSSPITRSSPVTHSSPVTRSSSITHFSPTPHSPLTTTKSPSRGSSKERRRPGVKRRIAHTNTPASAADLDPDQSTAHRGGGRVRQARAVKSRSRTAAGRSRRRACRRDVEKDADGSDEAFSLPTPRSVDDIQSAVTVSETDSVVKPNSSVVCESSPGCVTASSNSNNATTSVASVNAGSSTPNVDTETGAGTNASPSSGTNVDGTASGSTVDALGVGDNESKSRRRTTRSSRATSRQSNKRKHAVTDAANRRKRRKLTAIASDSNSDNAEDSLSVAADLAENTTLVKEPSPVHTVSASVSGGTVSAGACKPAINECSIPATDGVNGGGVATSISCPFSSAMKVCHPQHSPTAMSTVSASSGSIFSPSLLGQPVPSPCCLSTAPRSVSGASRGTSRSLIGVSRRQAASTPRRRRSHVRALDFTTPPPAHCMREAADDSAVSASGSHLFGEGDGDSLAWRLRRVPAVTRRLLVDACDDRQCSSPVTVEAAGTVQASGSGSVQVQPGDWPVLETPRPRRAPAAEFTQNTSGGRAECKEMWPSSTASACDNNTSLSGSNSPPVPRTPATPASLRSRSVAAAEEHSLPELETIVTRSQQHVDPGSPDSVHLALSCSSSSSPSSSSSSPPAHRSQPPVLAADDILVSPIHSHCRRSVPPLSSPLTSPGSDRLTIASASTAASTPNSACRSRQFCLDEASSDAIAYRHTDESLTRSACHALLKLSTSSRSQTPRDHNSSQTPPAAEATVRESFVFRGTSTVESAELAGSFAGNHQVSLPVVGDDSASGELDSTLTPSSANLTVPQKPTDSSTVQQANSCKRLDLCATAPSKSETVRSSLQKIVNERDNVAVESDCSSRNELSSVVNVTSAGAVSCGGGGSSIHQLTLGGATTRSSTVTAAVDTSDTSSSAQPNHTAITVDDNHRLSNGTNRAVSNAVDSKASTQVDCDGRDGDVCRSVEVSEHAAVVSHSDRTIRQSCDGDSVTRCSEPRADVSSAVSSVKPGGCQPSSCDNSDAGSADEDTELMFSEFIDLLDLAPTGHWSQYSEGVGLLTALESRLPSFSTSAPGDVAASSTVDSGLLSRAPISRRAASPDLMDMALTGVTCGITGGHRPFSQSIAGVEGGDSAASGHSDDNTQVVKSSASLADKSRRRRDEQHQHQEERGAKLQINGQQEQLEKEKASNELRQTRRDQESKQIPTEQQKPHALERITKEQQKRNGLIQIPLEQQEQQERKQIPLEQQKRQERKIITTEQQKTFARIEQQKQQEVKQTSREQQKLQEQTSREQQKLQTPIDSSTGQRTQNKKDQASRTKEVKRKQQSLSTSCSTRLTSDDTSASEQTTTVRSSSAGDSCLPEPPFIQDTGSRNGSGSLADRAPPIRCRSGSRQRAGTTSRSVSSNSVPAQSTSGAVESNGHRQSDKPRSKRRSQLVADKSVTVALPRSEPAQLSSDRRVSAGGDCRESAKSQSQSAKKTRIDKKAIDLLKNIDINSFLESIHKE